MKTKYVLIALLSSLCVLQACGPKSKENTTESSISKEDSLASQKAADEAKANDEKLAKEQARAERKKMAEARKTSDTYEVSGVTVHNKVTVKPEFKGGKGAMAKYFKENLKYPDDQTWNGTIVVDFVVGEDGKVQFAEVVEDEDSVPDPSFQNEAIRVIKEMPAWTAGSQGGKPVASSYSLPVTFQHL